MPDSGNVFIQKNVRFGLLEQNAEYDSENTVLDEMLGAFSHLIKTEKELNELRELADGGNESAAMKFAVLHEKFVSDGGLEYAGRCKGMLRSLGLSSEFWDSPITSLSGGQKTRIALAKLLISDPDIILLDEPTNHLDIDSIMWLEKFLSSCRKTVIVVSHDRYFLCKTTNRTLEIENTKGRLYGGNYDYYIAEKKREREILEHQYKNQQKNK